MPGIRLAAIDAPTPLPHRMIPRSAPCSRSAAPDRLGVVGVVDRLAAVGADVEHLAVLAQQNALAASLSSNPAWSEPMAMRMVTFLERGLRCGGQS